MTINAEGEHPRSIKQIRVVHCKMAIARSSWSRSVEKKNQKVQFFDQSFIPATIPNANGDAPICINSALIKTKSKNMTQIITNIKMFFWKG